MGLDGQWQWDSRQRTNTIHIGVLGQIWLDVDWPGLHTIMFSMREDGFEFDRFLLTKQQNAMESKSTETGPPASRVRRDVSWTGSSRQTHFDLALISHRIDTYRRKGCSRSRSEELEAFNQG